MRCRQEPFLLESSSCPAQGGAGTSQGNRLPHQHFQTSWASILTPDGPVGLGGGQSCSSVGLQWEISSRLLGTCWDGKYMVQRGGHVANMGLFFYTPAYIHPIHLSPPLQHQLFPCSYPFPWGWEHP